MHPFINLSSFLYKLEPKEFRWPFSTLYSWIATAMEPGYQHISRVIDLPQHVETVLDIGGGDGRLAVALTRRYPHISQIVTADISKHMVERARKRMEVNSLKNRIRAEIADVHNLMYEDSSFDVIVSFASMHHWRDPVKALKELDRVLKPNGILAVMDGYGRPSFKNVKETVTAFGGSIWASIIYWIGSKDVLLYDEIVQIVIMSGIKYVSISCDGPVAIITGVKVN